MYGNVIINLISLKLEIYIFCQIEDFYNLAKINFEKPRALQILARLRQQGCTHRYTLYMHMQWLSHRESYSKIGEMRLPCILNSKAWSPPTPLPHSPLPPPPPIKSKFCEEVNGIRRWREKGSQLGGKIGVSRPCKLLRFTHEKFIYF
jgi:hypothetical protein